MKMPISKNMAIAASIAGGSIGFMTQGERAEELGDGVFHQAVSATGGAVVGSGIGVASAVGVKATSAALRKILRRGK